ncbi:MAG TPA: HAMP domain-containing sensor histidine kinase [Polyangia bacterium]|nr:HAMP domain-containing sensor histidine kinase [Polyangia bacterium]
MNPASTCEARLELMHKLLGIKPTGLRESLEAGSSAIADVFMAEKVDAMIFEEPGATLVARATAGSPMAQQQRQIGMDRQPVANGGRAAEVFTTGISFRSDDVQNDPKELTGVKALGVHSQMAVAFDIADRRAGVLTVMSSRPAAWDDGDLRFFETVASWLALVAGHVQRTEQLLSLASERARRVVAGDLISAVAHDVGNHLAAMRLRLALLERIKVVADNSDAAVALSASTEAVQWLAQLTNDLLDAERLDSGQSTLATASVDLCQIARQAATVRAAGSSNVAIACQGAATVIGDPSRLRQALDNLIANAVLHSRPDARVRVLVRPGLRRGAEQVDIIVQDDGEGVDPAVISRIGRKFAAGRHSPGVGLGLYIVQSIAAAHGGSVSVESPPGEGARFVLSIPLIPPDPHRGPGPAAA